MTPDTILRWHAAPHRMEVDLGTQAARTPSGDPGDPATGRADGRRESNLGLHPDLRCPEERGPSCGAIDDRPDPERARHSSGARAPVLVGTFLRTHSGAIAGADFFTTEVWTWRGLVTYDTRFVIDLATRRVQMVGCTSHPDEAFMCQAGRTMTATDEGAVVGCRVLICDRDQKWGAPLRHLLDESGVRVVQTPCHALHGNAHAGALRTIHQGRRPQPRDSDRERHLRRAVHEFVEHDHRERHHQRLGQ